MALLSNLRINDKVISTIPKPTDINVEGLTLHLARYTALENNKAINCVNEPLLLNSMGHHEKVRDGSHYDFYGESRNIESENLASESMLIYDGRVPSISSGQEVSYQDMKTDFIKVNVNYIYAGLTNNSGYAITLYVLGYDQNKNYLSYVGLAINNNETKSTGYSTNNLAYIKLRVGNNGGALSGIKNLFLSTQNQYTPHFDSYIRNKGYKNEVSIANDYRKFRWNSPTNATFEDGKLKYTVSSSYNDIWTGYYLSYTDFTSILDVNRKVYCSFKIKSTKGGSMLYGFQKSRISITLQPNTETFLEFVGNFKDDTINMYMGGANNIVEIEEFTLLNADTLLGITLPQDSHYYLPFNNTLIDLGDEPLRQGEVRSTDGRRTHNRVKIIIDGTESRWNLNETNTNTCRYVNDNLFSIPASNTLNTTFLNNRFVGVNGNTGIGSIDYESIAIRDARNGVTIRSTIKNIDDFRAWLKANPIELEYEITPTTSILDTYEFESGLLGADNETPRYALDYNYVESIECKSENLWLGEFVKNKDYSGNTVSNWLSCFDYVKVKSSTNHFFKCDGFGTNSVYATRIEFYNNSKELLSYISNQWYKPSQNGFTFATPNNCEYIRIFFYYGSSVNDINLTNIMLNEGNVAKPHQPYYNSSKQLNLAILNNGSLVNNLLSNEYAVVNAWEIEWSLNPNASNVFQATISGKALNDRINAIASIYEVANVGYSTMDDKSITSRLDNETIYIKDSRFTDVATFKAYLQANNVKIIFKLANKVEYDIETPSTPTALECNVNANSKGVAIEYAKQN